MRQKEGTKILGHTSGSQGLPTHVPVPVCRPVILRNDIIDGQANRMQIGLAENEWNVHSVLLAPNALRETEDFDLAAP